MTDLKFLNGPRSNGFSPGFVCSIANVLIASEGSWLVFTGKLAISCALENEIVRNPGDICGALGMYTASVQTMVFLERFSIVVELIIANWRELPVMPMVNRPKRAPLNFHKLRIYVLRDGCTHRHKVTSQWTFRSCVCQHTRQPDTCTDVKLSSVHKIVHVRQERRPCSRRSLPGL